MKERRSERAACSTRDVPVMKSTWEITRDTVNEFIADNAMQLAAALSYYAIFSLAPLLVIAVGVAGIIFGEAAAQKEILAQISDLAGPQAAEALTSVFQASGGKEGGIMATIIGSALLLFGATSVFGQLQSSLNAIWNVEPKPGQGVMGFIRTRFLSLGMVFAIGFLLLTSLVLSAALSALDGYLNTQFPGAEIIWQVVNFVVSLGVIALLFAVIFRYLPDAEISWRDVFIGALATSVLFNVGKFGIGLYLGNSSAGSAYGAAGSLVVVLLWVYYSSLILFFGAEFTQVYARRFGSRIQPSSHAVRVEITRDVVEEGKSKRQRREEVSS